MGNYSLIKGNPERLKKESDRINNFQRNKYATDENYRDKQKAYMIAYRAKNKVIKTEVPVPAN